MIFFFLLRAMKNTKPTIPSLKHFYTKKLAYEEFFKLAPPRRRKKSSVIFWTQIYGNSAILPPSILPLRMQYGWMQCSRLSFYMFCLSLVQFTRACVPLKWFKVDFANVSNGTIQWLHRAYQSIIIITSNLIYLE